MGGAIPGRVFLEMMLQAGFVDAEVIGETGFNTSPVTKGVTIRAFKHATAMPLDVAPQCLTGERVGPQSMFAQTCGMQRNAGGG